MIRRTPPNEYGNWRVDAACRFFGPQLFFGPENETRDVRLKRERKAKSVCKSCAVILHCRAFSIQHQEPIGIWGGTCARERRQRKGVLADRSCRPG
ncbi:WhiB family transcriptional regulator [Rhodococcus erythropolis]